MATDVAKKAGVRKLALFHHEPSHDDRTMRAIEREGKSLFSQTMVAHEGLKLSL
jgi:phosphoribosyl 1,2-cyclic phosphodiesterase